VEDVSQFGRKRSRLAIEEAGDDGDDDYDDDDDGVWVPGGSKQRGSSGKKREKKKVDPAAEEEKARRKAEKEEQRRQKEEVCHTLHAPRVLCLSCVYFVLWAYACVFRRPRCRTLCGLSRVYKILAFMSSGEVSPFGVPMALTVPFPGRSFEEAKGSQACAHWCRVAEGESQGRTCCHVC
jgi:hypothetical protein